MNLEKENEADYLRELNPAQRKAVEETEGALLILAGAGAGKTKTITYRVLHLIKNGVLPGNILAVTFTNKAAKEMQERVAHIMHNTGSMDTFFEGEKPFVSTFHSLGVKIIKDNHEILGLRKHFSIYDRSDSKRAIKESLEKHNYNVKEFEPNKILGVISREKGNFVTAGEYKEKASNEYFGKIVGEVWESYEDILKKENALDFDDLILVTAKLLTRNEKVREHYANIWKYIHVDEYQDTNKVQYAIIKALSEKNKNICVVGDADQNIYSWRGANIKNILNFEKDFPGSKIVLLEENYRSTQTILATANRVIEKNKMRMEKKLVTQNGIGEKVGIFSALNENHEAQFIAEKINELVKSGTKYSDIAVLYRANFQSRVLEEECMIKEIPYHVLGTKFFDRKEIKDIMSFLRLALNPDSVGDLKRVINLPPRGIGKTTLLKIVEGKIDNLPGAMKIKYTSFQNIMREIRDFATSNRPSETIMFIANKTGLLESLSKSEEDTERRENIKELAVLASRYDTLEGEEAIEKLLEDTALATDQDSDDKDREAVRLMTAHASKGLEFSYVFITGLEDGLFPHNRDESVNEEEKEEERRLFYVALTRAKKKLFLSYAQTRSIYGRTDVNMPSEFLMDIPEQYSEEEFLDFTPKRRPLLHIEF